MGCRRWPCALTLATMALTLCFAALLAAYAASPQLCLTIYPLQRDTSCGRLVRHGRDSQPRCLPMCLPTGKLPCVLLLCLRRTLPFLNMLSRFTPYNERILPRDWPVRHGRDSQLRCLPMCYIFLLFLPTGRLPCVLLLCLRCTLPFLNIVFPSLDIDDLTEARLAFLLNMLSRFIFTREDPTEGLAGSPRAGLSTS